MVANTPRISSEIFAPGKSFKATANTTSAAIAINASGAEGDTLVIYNAGTVPVIIAVGLSTVVAVVPTATPTVSRHAVGPGSTQSFRVGSATHVALITESSTADVYGSMGTGI